MIKIRFTQCGKVELDEHSKQAALMPIIPRLRFYEELLLGNEDAEYTTLDEHFLLAAQFLWLRGQIRSVIFVSICDCPGNTFRELVIGIDDEGDFNETPHHGFFPQRLRYLRQTNTR